MLTVNSNQFSGTCQTNSRREFLRVGALGLGGLTLADLMGLKALGSENKSYDILRDKSVVVLNLQGGPTHIETFDPKMTAPSEYRAMFGEVKTSLPGVTFGHHFPMLGKLAHKMAVVRSFRHGNGSHGSAAALVAAGGNPTGVNMGSLYARIAGITSTRTGLPNNCVVVPSTYGKRYDKLNNQASRITSLGNLPKSYAAFDPSKGGAILDDMQLRLPEGRFDNRRGLLSRIDDLKRSADNALSSADSLHQKAFDVILGGVTDAFDLSEEDPRTVERYERSITGKTASLLATACRIGAIVGELPRPVVESLTEFGLAYGMAFQVVDDILDIVATDEELGKPAGNDLLEGIYTLPVIHALAEENIATELRPLLTSSITADERDRARDLIRSSNGIRTALDVAQGWADKAAGTLTDLPDTPGAHALRAASADLIERANAPLS